MSALQPQLIHFKNILTYDGMPVEGFVHDTKPVPAPSHRRSQKVETADLSLMINTQAAHDGIATVFDRIATEQKRLNFSRLILSKDVTNIDLKPFLRACPHITYLDIASNASLEIRQVLKFPTLSHLHIQDPQIFWNKTEKHDILSHGYRQNLRIQLGKYLYRFDYPSRLFFRVSFITLEFFLLLSVANLWTMPLTKKSMFPCTFIMANLILQYYLYDYLQQKKHDRSFEIIRQEKQSK